MKVVARGKALGGPARGLFTLERDLSRASRALVDEAPLAPSARVLVIVPDRTRAFPVAETLHPLLERLLEAGVQAERIEVAIASGAHVTAPSDVERLGDLPPGITVLAHDPNGPTVSAGTTPAGTDVLVHPRLMEADVVFALGGIAFHYFAGFGGGGKMLFPGLGGRGSIAANHRRALAPEHGLAEGVEPGRTRDNPVARDLRDAHLLLPRARHLSVWPTEQGWVAARWTDFATFDAVCGLFAEFARKEERHGADVVIATCGEPPRDIDVVQAHKALFHAALFARDGGEILFLAPCPEGVGSPALERWLARPDRATLEADARAAYDLNAQTAISLATIAARVRVTWYSPFPLPWLERWGIEVRVDPDESIARATALKDAGARVLVLPGAADVIPATL